MWAALAKLAAPIFGAAAGGAAQNRSAKEQAQLSRDQLALQAQEQYERSLMDRARLESDQRNDAMRNAYRADAVKGYAPLTVKGPGGQSISLAMGPGALDTAATVERQALLRLLEGGPTGTQYGTYQMPALQRFTPTAAPKMSWWEKLLNIAAPAAGLYGAFSDARGGGSSSPGTSTMGLPGR